MSESAIQRLQREIAERSRELVSLLAAEQAPPPAPAYLTIEGFAERYQVSTRTVRRMIARGMPFRRPRPLAVRIPVAAAEAWIASAPERAAPERVAPLDATSSGVRS